MHQMEFSEIKAFLRRRYAIRLGRRYASAAASFIVLGLVGCSEVNNIDSSVAQSVPLKQQESFATEQVVTSVVNSKLIAANTKFGFKLFSEILKQDKNIFISPVSVALALAMTYNGASGETQQAMAKTLEVQGIISELNSGNAAMLATLEDTDSQVELTIANSLWVRKEYPIKQDFLQRSQKFYKAKVTNLDFSDRNAPSVIDNWVKQSTDGKINQIIANINPNDVLFLINAIYFKGKWTTEFAKNQTADYPFYLAAGSQKQHPMMSQKGEYRYYENEKLQAVSLPYGKDGKLSLYIFLPNQNTSLSDFYQGLNTENWEKWMTLFRNREGLIRLPRFRIEYDITLNDTLKALGMGVAFGDKANFSGIGDNLLISEVKHKTFVEVNEEGTEAAAATSVAIAVTAAPAQEPFLMIVDRPFFYSIRNNQTGTVLFMGSIVEPQLGEARE